MSGFLLYPVNGYTLQFTARRTWTAKRRLDGRLIDVIPCTWTRDIRQDEHGHKVVTVYYPNPKARMWKAANYDPFVVAIMTAKNWQARPLSFKAFVTLYEVRATGKILGERSIEAEILRPITA